jgi:hypothetical protein
MRFSSSLICLAIVVVCAPAAVHAQEASYLSAQMSARRELEIAKMELRDYWQVEYPRKQRHLNALIELTEAEIRDYKAQLRDWEPYNRFTYGSAFLITIQNTRWCLRDAELRLRDLWAERNALVRFHSDQWRLLEMRVFDARLRVAELEGELEPQVSTTIDDRPAI